MGLDSRLSATEFSTAKHGRPPLVWKPAPLLVHFCRDAHPCSLLLKQIRQLEGGGLASNSEIRMGFSCVATCTL